MTGIEGPESLEVHDFKYVGFIGRTKLDQLPRVRRSSSCSPSFCAFLGFPQRLPESRACRSGAGHRPQGLHEVGAVVRQFDEAPWPTEIEEP